MYMCFNYSKKGNNYEIDKRRKMNDMREKNKIDCGKNRNKKEKLDYESGALTPELKMLLHLGGFEPPTS